MRRVLILSRADDGHIPLLTAQLERIGAPWIIFDPGAFPASALLTARMDCGTNARITLPDGQLLRLDEIGSVWYRRPSPIKAAADLPELQRIFIEREGRAGIWGMLRAIDGLWVNHPGANSEAAYKSQQLVLARRLGLSIPRTLLTNEPDEFLRFYEQCNGNVIYKLLGFPAYEVEESAIASTYTSRVPESFLAEAQRIKGTAHLFQEFVEKICDLRVIIMGQSIFVVEIYPLSEDTHLDFRLDYQSLRYGVRILPPMIERALFAMVRSYGLQYAAIDLLYTVDERYVFLELNPCGQLGWLEEPTGLPLFASLARLLAGVG